MLEQFRILAAPKEERIQGLFLKGPIPWDWLCLATTTYPGGKSLQVGLKLWFQRGLSRGRPAKFNMSRFQNEMGISRDATRRALKALEAAGLIRVVRRPGRAPIVEIILCPEKSANGTQ